MSTPNKETSSIAAFLIYQLPSCRMQIKMGSGVTNPIGISYMGTKRQLAGLVSRLVAKCQRGPFLDAFSGMCAVGTAIAPSRQIWSNDLQHFASLVATARFCSKVTCPDKISMAELCHHNFGEHKEQLMRKMIRHISVEEDALRLEQVDALRNVFDKSITRANKIKQPEDNYGYDLFTTRFGGNYFSITQAIEADSIRFALDAARNEGLMSSDLHQWGLVALCIALSKSSSTTGHFAQPLSPKVENFRRFRGQRSRRLWTEWLNAVGQLEAVGSVKWRSRNRTFRNDALTLLSSLTTERIRPKVVYADPPYTKDQYSRYYHLYETAILYDYPLATGNGLYRDTREVSTFSQRSTVDSSIEDLIRMCADLRADLIISYPTNGLLPESRERIPELLRQFYRKKVDAMEIPYIHSTMGASKGAGRNDVTEVIYSACM